MAGEIQMMQAIYMRRFEKAGAKSPATARPLADLRVHRNPIFKGLAKRGIFVEAEPGRWYMDPQAAGAFRERQRILAMIALAIVAAAAVIYVVYALVKK